MTIPTLTAALAFLAATAHAVTVDDIQNPDGEPAAKNHSLWLDYDQDNYAPSDDGGDDGYTAGLRAGYRFDSDATGPWTFTACWSMFTKRNPGDDDMHGVRSDEALVTTQREFMAGPVFLTAGPGVLLVGDLGGDQAQHSVHRLSGDKQYDLTYEDGEGNVRWLLAMAATARWRPLYTLLAHDGLGRAALAVDVRAGLLVHQEQIRLQLMPAFTYLGSTDGSLTIAPLIELTAGDGLSASARPDHHVNYGTQGHMYAAFLHFGLVVTRDRTYGTLGLRF